MPTRDPDPTNYIDNPLAFRDADEFHAWLEDHHDRVKKADLLLAKKTHADRGIGYEDAVRTALRWGWIDSVTRRHDDALYKQRYSPRKKGSLWSASNIRRVKVLLAEERMKEPGLAAFDMELLDKLPEIEAAQEERRLGPTTLPPFAQELVESAEGAPANWEAQPPSHRCKYVGWIMSAKRGSTRVRRVRKMIEMMAEGRSPSEL
jgi:uncharacterized protein YdeI (YjbR/CyaY-like superfamily)